MRWRANLETLVSKIRSLLQTIIWKRTVAWIELRYLAGRGVRVEEHSTLGEAILAAVKIADCWDLAPSGVGHVRPVAVEVHTRQRMEAAISISKMPLA